MFDTDEERSLADRRADASREAILEAAWARSRREGLMGWSLRALAKDVGLAAPSLYAYFDGKDAIYDAMFRQGYESFLAAVEAEVPPEEPRALLCRVADRYLRFCTEDPVRYQLLFQRVVPGFEPSPQAYAPSVAVYERLRSAMAGIGVTDDADLDLWTALVTGLASQQLSNDPDGDRWTRLVPSVVDLFCTHVGITTPGDTP